MDCSLPDSSVYGILQAKILEWAAIFSSSRDLPDPGTQLLLLCHLHWQVGFLPLAPPGKPSIMLTIGLLQMFFIKLKIFPSIPS